MGATCYHCGNPCKETVTADGKQFCCNGCSQVYLLLQENNLCSYYDLDKNPGIKSKGRYKGERFAYLNDPAVLQKLASFVSDDRVHIRFRLPQMHCSSCVFLLENLHKIHAGVYGSQVNFPKKELFVSYDPGAINLQQLVELLAFIGYEPYISLHDIDKKKTSAYDRGRLLQLGVAGFAFANIMMLSFPEYFSGGRFTEPGLRTTFTQIIFFLSIPVLFYSARSFFISAYKGLRQKILNIDLPIVLAILITFGRSYYEIISGTGPGYLDSGTGIIFFMLIGRWFQDKSYAALSFDRDALSYFPLGVSVIRDGREMSVAVTDLHKGEKIIVRHAEMVPADSLLESGDAMIDYSFVTGESMPVHRKKGEIVHAGGKQQGGKIMLSLIKEPSRSYITELWNKDGVSDKNKEESFIHPWSRYFTGVLLTIAFLSGVYWYFMDSSMLLPVVSSVLIVACPCSLLLTSTFTFGNMLRVFGKNRIYLKNAGVIESMAGIDTVVFDKTGTITYADRSKVTYHGRPLSVDEQEMISGLGSQSGHVLSRRVVESLPLPAANIPVTEFMEVPGSGISANVVGRPVRLGSRHFSGGIAENCEPISPRVYARIGDETTGYFEVNNLYRDDIPALISGLKKLGIELHLLSGDNEAERENLSGWFDPGNMRFHSSPQDKLDYVNMLKEKGRHVMMVGDGLNDAGALRAGHAGIAVSDRSGHFTPACDAIMDGSSLTLLPEFISYARSGRRIIAAGFGISIIYNIIGLSFSVQGLLSPVVAAILMPVSSITLVSLATILSALTARNKGL